MRKVRTLLRRHRGHELFEGRVPARYEINLITLKSQSDSHGGPEEPEVEKTWGKGRGSLSG